MGRIARVIENIANRVNMNLGGFFNNECDKVQPSGDDSRPLAKDDGYATQWGGAGRFVVLGYFDYDNKIAQPGEKRIYGRDSSGNVTSHVYLQNSGVMELKNDGWTVTYNPDGTKTETNGAYTKTVAADGKVDINGFIINPDGSASSPVSVTAPLVNGTNDVTFAGISGVDHVHPQGVDSDGDTQQNTGVAQ